MNSVLHVALIAPNGYSNEPFMKAFLDNGFTTYHAFDYQLQSFEYGHERMRENLLKLADYTKPDLIFLHVQSSEVLDYDTVIKLSAIGFTVLYTFDCRTTKQTEWMYNYAKHLGLVCFSNQDDVQECMRRGILNTMVVQSSCDMDFYKDDSPKVTKNGVVFIGGNYLHTNLEFPLAQERSDMVKFLKEEYKDQFDVHGMGWTNSNLYNRNQEKVAYNIFSIAISHNNFNKHLYTSDRIWRIMATGAFCLTRHFDGIEQLFVRGVHLDWWHTFGELKDKIDYYLINSELREQIAANGMYLVRQKHTWSCRIAEILVKALQLKPKSENCRDAHRVNGELPIEEKHGGKVCDCGKYKYEWESCGCGEQKMEIRMYQNI